MSLTPISYEEYSAVVQAAGKSTVTIRTLDIGGDKTSWEYESLPNLVSRGEVNSYRHEGFWHPMDTLRDREELSYLWESNRAPWKVWS